MGGDLTGGSCDLDALHFLLVIMDELPQSLWTCGLKGNLNVLCMLHNVYSLLGS